MLKIKLFFKKRVDIKAASSLRLVLIQAEGANANVGDKQRGKKNEAVCHGQTGDEKKAQSRKAKEALNRTGRTGHHRVFQKPLPYVTHIRRGNARQTPG